MILTPPRPDKFFVITKTTRRKYPTRDLMHVPEGAKPIVATALKLPALTFSQCRDLTRTRPVVCKASPGANYIPQTKHSRILQSNFYLQLSTKVSPFLSLAGPNPAQKLPQSLKFGGEKPNAVALVSVRVTVKLFVPPYTNADKNSRNLKRSGRCYLWQILGKAMDVERNKLYAKTYPIFVVR